MPLEGHWKRTNTPLHAFATLNDPQFVEAARNLAQTTLQAGDKPEARIDFMAKRLLARSFSAEEIPVGVERMYFPIAEIADEDVAAEPAKGE